MSSSTAAKEPRTPAKAAIPPAANNHDDNDDECTTPSSSRKKKTKKTKHHSDDDDDDDLSSPHHQHKKKKKKNHARRALKHLLYHTDCPPLGGVSALFLAATDMSQDPMTKEEEEAQGEETSATGHHRSFEFLHQRAIDPIVTAVASMLSHSKLHVFGHDDWTPPIADADVSFPFLAQEKERSRAEPTWKLILMEGATELKPIRGGNFDNTYGFHLDGDDAVTHKFLHLPSTLTKIAPESWEPFSNRVDLSYTAIREFVLHFGRGWSGVQHFKVPRSLTNLFATRMGIKKLDLSNCHKLEELGLANLPCLAELHLPGTYQSSASSSSCAAVCSSSSSSSLKAISCLAHLGSLEKLTIPASVTRLGPSHQHFKNDPKYDAPLHGALVMLPCLREITIEEGEEKEKVSAEGDVATDLFRACISLKRIVLPVSWAHLAKQASFEPWPPGRVVALKWRDPVTRKVEVAKEFKSKEALLEWKIKEEILPEKK